MVTREYLMSRLNYNPVTGIFTWKPITVTNWRHKTWNKRFAGTVAGADAGKGHIKIGLNGKLHFAHRLAWLYVYGEWPKDQLDHKDRRKSNNAILNLRNADTSKNKANMNAPITNKSGVKGVYWSKQRNKWCAQIKVNQKRITIGFYDDLSDAASAYADHAVAHFGEFAHFDGATK